MLNRKILSAVCVLAGLMPFTGAQASSLDYLSNDGSITSGWGATVQTFTAGAGQTLTDYSFVGASGSQASFKFSLYDWTTGSTALYTTTQAWVGGVNTVSGINATLQAGDVYAAEVDYLGPTSGGVAFGGDVYADGAGFWGASGLDGNQAAYTAFPSLDTAFKADFNVSTVPEQGTAAMLLAGLGILGAIGRRRLAK